MIKTSKKTIVTGRLNSSDLRFSRPGISLFSELEDLFGHLIFQVDDLQFEFGILSDMIVKVLNNLIVRLFSSVFK